MSVISRWAAADSVALAGGQELLSELRVRGDHETAWRNADEFASRNRVGPHNALLKNDEDVVVGRLDDPADRTTLRRQIPKESAQKTFSSMAERWSWAPPRRCRLLTTAVASTRAEGRTRDLQIHNLAL
jgi:hypothetical protein